MNNTTYDYTTLAYHAVKLLYEHLENITSNPFTEQNCREHMLYVQTHNYLKQLREMRDLTMPEQKKRRK